MGKAFTEEEIKSIREKLLQEGERIFVEKGIKKANIKDFTSAVGIAAGSFYRFFESKEALLLEWMDIYNSEIFEMQKKILQNQIEVNKFDFEEIIMATFMGYKKKPAYMMVFERNEEYKYILSKISKETIAKNTKKDRDDTNYLLDEAEKHWKLSPNYNREIVYGIFQYMFAGLVNSKMVGFHVIDEILKIHAKVLDNYVKTGVLDLDINY